MSRLLYRNDFNSSTLAPVSLANAWDKGAWQDFAIAPSPDPTLGRVRLLSLTDPVLALDGNTLIVESTIKHAIVAGAGRHGSSALVSTILKSGHGTKPQGWDATQAALQFLPRADLHTFYSTRWMKLQPNLVDVMAVAMDPVNGTGGAWREILCMKTGGQMASGLSPANDGDYRCQLAIYAQKRRDPYWALVADNNGGGSAPLVNNFHLENLDVPVPVGEWFKLEWAFRRGTSGRVVVRMNDEELFNYRGPFMGAYGMPINRLFEPVLYSGSETPIWQAVDEIEAWTLPPPQSSIML